MFMWRAYTYTYFCLCMCMCISYGVVNECKVAGQIAFNKQHKQTAAMTLSRDSMHKLYRRKVARINVQHQNKTDYQ